MLNAAEIASALALAVALLFASIVEAAFGAVSRTSARRLLEETRPHAEALNALLERRAEVQTSLDVLVLTLVAADSAFLFSLFMIRDFVVIGAPAAVGLVFISILILRHLIPQLVTARNPEVILIRLFPLVRLSAVVMRPFSQMLTATVNRFRRWEEETKPAAAKEEAAEDEIQAFIDAGEEEGILESGESEMIQSIVHFGNKVAREVMTPRTQIAAIDIDASFENLLDLIVTSGHSRIPVFRGNIDNVEGVIHERDLLLAWRNGEKPSLLQPFAKPVHFIPETKPVDDLLQEMKQDGEPMVLVVDEYGGISGLITVEDLVEEIVGDIHDTAPDGRKAIEESAGVFIVPGTLELNALGELLGRTFVENTECTTVAGAVVELFGKLPSSGERIEHNGIAVDVLDADRRRVNRLRMRVLAAEPPQTNGQPAQPGSAAV